MKFSQYIDGIQIPGMIWGDLEIRGGRLYFNDGMTIRPIRLTTGQLEYLSRHLWS